MKHRFLTAAGASLMVATPAIAHTGDHGEHVMTMALHWLSSPSHSLFAVVGGVIGAAILVKLARKSRT